MIGQIKGKIIDISPTRTTVDIGGLGLIIHSTSSQLEKLKIGGEVRLWTHMAVRENDISLYGFGSEEELKMFQSLISVSGIGPKSALVILGVAGLKALEDAIVSGNIGILTKIAGIGRKTADKIVLELSGKVGVSSGTSESMKDNLDVFEALKALGYRDHNIQEVLKEMPESLSGANEKIRHALKMLGKN